MMPFIESSSYLQGFIFSEQQRFHHPTFLFHWIVTPVNTMLKAYETSMISLKEKRTSDAKAKIRFLYGAILTASFLDTMKSSLITKVKNMDPVNDFMERSKALFDNYKKRGKYRYHYCAEYVIQGLIICYTYATNKAIRADGFKKWLSKNDKPFNSKAIVSEDIQGFFKDDKLCLSVAICGFWHFCA